MKDEQIAKAKMIEAACFRIVSLKNSDFDKSERDYHRYPQTVLKTSGSPLS